jgi:hypothetical protein
LILVALPGLEPGLFALRGRRVNQLHHNAMSNRQEAESASTAVTPSVYQTLFAAPILWKKYAAFQLKFSILNHLPPIFETTEVVLKYKKQWMGI